MKKLCMLTILLLTLCIPCALADMVIEDEAFMGCTELTEVVIPGGTTSIGERAFYGCTGLTSVTIPDSVTYIGKDAFSGNGDFFFVVSPGSYAEQYCKNHGFKTGSLYEYYLSADGNATLTSYKGTATHITIPEKINGYPVTAIGGWAFQCCDSLTSITIPGSVTDIGEYAFSFCSSLTSVHLQEGVTNIGWRAFEFCGTLKSITIPASVTSIGGYAFDSCFALESINIPASVTSIGEGAFASCYGLNQISIAPGNTTFIISNGGLIDRVHKRLLFVPCSCSGNYVIPDGVTSIDAYVFSNCSSLTSITFPNSITSIGDWAFSCCSSLTSVNIPSSVKSIGESAFTYCFALTSVTIPKGVTSIGDAAFTRCLYIEEFNLSAENTTFTFVNGGLIDRVQKRFVSCLQRTSGDYVIPAGVTSIGDSAFDWCLFLDNVTIPSGVTSIGGDAFNMCNLTSLTIPASVTSIGYCAFTSGTCYLPVTVVPGSYAETFCKDNNVEYAYAQ